MKPRSLLALANFFAAAHFSLIVYIAAPYLATFMPDAATGLVVSLGAIMTLLAFPLMPSLVRTYGMRRLAILFAVLEAFILAWLSVAPAAAPAVLFVALAFAVPPLIYYQLDLFLEATVTKEGSTGRIRTLFLTSGNLAYAAAPLAAGLILDSGEAYWRVFALAAASLLPFILVIGSRKIPRGAPPTLVSMLEAWKGVARDRDLRAVLGAQAMLQLFYRMVPLYIPLFLHTQLGIPWQDLGWLLTAMLAPLVLLEYLAGTVADRILGDQELLIAGFIIVGLALGALSLVTADTMNLVILIILVMAGCGVALIESMSEGHFFRRVSEADAAPVSIFRMTRPFMSLVGPVIGSIILSVSSYAALFVITGALIGIIGVMAAVRITDIK